MCTGIVIRIVLSCTVHDRGSNHATFYDQETGVPGRESEVQNCERSRKVQKGVASSCALGLCPVGDDHPHDHES
jgi:hypothetical protein